MKDNLENKILEYLSENDNGEYIDLSFIDGNKELLKDKLKELKNDKLIKEQCESTFIGTLRILKNPKYRIEIKGNEKLNAKNITLNNFNNSTIGQFNQSEELSVLKTEIKQTIQPKAKEKQQNAIISFIEKFWWQILIPLVLGIALLAIQQKWFT